MENKAGSSHLWQAVGAAAAALVALVTLAAYLWPNSSASGTASVPTASASHSTAAYVPQSPASPSTASSPDTSPIDATSTVLAQTTVRVSEEDASGVDVGSLPLTISTIGVVSFWAGGGEIHAGVDETSVIAAWSAPGQPTAAGCENLLRTQPTSNLSNHAGLQFCMEGIDTRRVAAGKVLSYDGTVSEVRVTVWDDVLD